MTNIFNRFRSNIEGLLKLELNLKLAVAVSGGSDSVALLHLLHLWRLKNRNFNINITVLTVNHNLRAESARECEYVKDLAKSLGAEAVKFKWDYKNNFSNLQSRARSARYEFMTDYCVQHEIPFLLTAHHLDDKIENFLIRQNRKCSIFGLSSNNTLYLNGIKIIRPLHNILKKEIVNYLIENNIKWFEDISNYSESYERGKIRKTLLNLSETFKQNLFAEQIEIDKKLPALQNLLNKAFTESCVIYKYGFAVIKLKFLKDYSNDINFQLISYVLTIIGGNLVTPRGRVLTPIISLIFEEKDFIRTLCGCFVKKIGENLIVIRLFGKKIPENIIIKDEYPRFWDNRFIIKNLPVGSFISFLNHDEYKSIKDKINLKSLPGISFKNHIKILFSLPVVKTLEKIIAIPHISFYNDASFKGVVEFTPKYSSRFINFKGIKIGN